MPKNTARLGKNGMKITTIISALIYESKLGLFSTPYTLLSEDPLVTTAFTNIICISIHFSDNDVVNTSNLHHDHPTQHTLPL